MATTTRDRRAHPRHHAELNCKLLRPAFARYITARTTDVGPGGARIDLRTTAPLEAGEVIDIAVAWNRDAVIRSRDLIAARVVRAGPLLSDRQQIAVRFETEQHRAEALADAPTAASAA